MLFHLKFIYDTAPLNRSHTIVSFLGETLVLSRKGANVPGNKTMVVILWIFKNWIRTRRKLVKDSIQKYILWVWIYNNTLIMVFHLEFNYDTQEFVFYRHFSKINFGSIKKYTQMPKEENNGDYSRSI